MAAWSLDRLERDEHRPASNAAAIKLVQQHQLELDKLFALSTSQSQSTAPVSTEPITLTWVEFAEPEAISSLALATTPAVVRTIINGATLADSCSVDSEDHPLRVWSKSLCSLDGDRMCAHIGHEAIYLKRHFPVSTARLVCFVSCLIF